MVRLRVKELAEHRGMRLAHVQRGADLSLRSVRRYWYSSRSGLERDAGTLQEVNLAALARIAAFLGVPPGDLLSEN